MNLRPPVRLTMLMLMVMVLSLPVLPSISTDPSYHAIASTLQTTTSLLFLAESDTRVEEEHPNSNYGRSYLRVDGAGDPLVESYLRFTLSGITGVAARATLRVHAFTDSDSGPAVYTTSNTWNETEITWNKRPARISEVVGGPGPVAANTWIEYDLTSLITGDGTYNFVLVGSSSDGLNIDSREGGRSPELVVTIANEPDPTALPSPTAIDVPTLIPTDIPTSVPTDLPTDIPTSVPTDLPTDIPTSVPTDLPPATPTAEAPDSVVMAAGDIACDPTSGSFNKGYGTSTSCRQLYTSDLVLEADAVLPLGDLQYEDGTLDKFLQSYDLSWGRVKDKSYPIVASHEYRTTNAAGYFDYFGARAGDRDKGYYSYDLGQWHLIALNSACSYVPGGCGTTSPQYQWLLQDLLAHPTACTLAYWHNPRYSSGSRHGNDSSVDPFWDLLYAHGVELVLTGHEHDYERFAPMNAAGERDDEKGVRQFVVGTGGKYLYGFGTIQPHSEARNSTTFGVLKLTLRSNSYDWEFVPEAGQTYTDAGSNPCH